MQILDLIKELPNVKILNAKSIHFNKLAPIHKALEGDITWLRPNVKNSIDLFNESSASCIICQSIDDNYLLSNKIIVISENPQYSFYLILQKLAKNLIPYDIPNIHPTSFISKDCVIGENVKIGAFSIINATEIGDNTIILSNVIIHPKTKIGKNCVVKENCSIGGQGFGYFKDPEGNLTHMPHIGGVEIEDNVHIYPFTNIDSGTLSPTIIRKGTIIDHFCHIGHNSDIGENNIITAKTVTCGGVVLGTNNFIGVNTVIKDKIEIGSNNIVGMGSVVTKCIPNNEVWFGNPCRKLKDNV